MIASGTVGTAADGSGALAAADGVELAEGGGVGAAGTADAAGGPESADGLSQPEVTRMASSKDRARWLTGVLYPCMPLPSLPVLRPILVAALVVAPRLAWAEATPATQPPETAGPPKAAEESKKTEEPKEEEGVEHTIVVGAGGDVDVDLGDGSVHGGVNAFVEWNAVPGWLELEVGASVIPADKGVEVPVGLLAKKPFRLTPWSEVLVGIGPELLTVSTPDVKGTYFGAVGALDFMFWPFGERVGLWAAPEYSVVFHDGAQSALGATGGVLLGW